MASGSGEEPKGGWSFFRRVSGLRVVVVGLAELVQGPALPCTSSEPSPKCIWTQSSSGKRVNKAKLGEKNAFYYDEQVQIPTGPG